MSNAIHSVLIQLTFLLNLRLIDSKITSSIQNVAIYIGVRLIMLFDEI